MNGTAIILASIMAAMPNGPVPEGKPVETAAGIDVRGIGVDLASTNRRMQNHTFPEHLTVTAWQNMPFSGVSGVKGQYKGEGYAFHLLHLLQQQLNFTYDIVLPEPQNLGIHENRNYTGVIKLLQDKKVDVAVSFIPFVPELWQVISYSTMIDEVGVTFMMKRPSYSAIGSGLMAPFTRQVWNWILIALVLFGPVSYIIIFLRTKIEERRGHEGYSLVECYWFAFGALIKQGATIEPVTDVTRILFSAWWIFIMVLTSFYTANLTAFLTLSQFTLPYDSVEDIIVARQEWFAYRDQIVEETLQFAHPLDHKDFHQLRNSYRDHLGMYINREKSDANVYRYLQDEKLFFCEVQLVEKMLYEDYKIRRTRETKESKRCEYVQLPGNLYTKMRGFGFPLNSPIADRMSRLLLHQVETGHIKHFVAVDLPGVRYCPLDLKSTERQLKNNDFALTYKIIGTGYGLGGIMFVLEVICKFGQKYKLWGKNCLCCPSMAIQDNKVTDFKKGKRKDFYNERNLPKSGNDSRGSDGSKKMWINGRNFWVIKEADGNEKLEPIGPPPIYEFRS